MENLKNHFEKEFIKRKQLEGTAFGFTLLGIITGIIGLYQINLAGLLFSAIMFIFSSFIKWCNK